MQWLIMWFELLARNTKCIKRKQDDKDSPRFYFFRAVKQTKDIMESY